MKKLLFVLLFSICLLSCTKEESLVGTIWVDSSSESIKKFEFYSETGCRFYIPESEFDVVIFYTYLYDSNTVSLFPEKDGWANLTGYIQSDYSMRVINTSSNETVGVFIKQ